MKKLRNAFAILIVILISFSLNYEKKSDKFNIDNKEEIIGETTTAMNDFNIDTSFNEDQWYIPFIEANNVWSLVDEKKEIKVAVVDTGVNYNHPELKDKVIKELGYDFYNMDNDPMDDGWHGTHVAGIISSVTGPVDVKIIPVKVMDQDGRGPSSVIAEGIKYAADTGADIINLSVDFDVKDEFIGEAIRYAYEKDVFVVVSAGNNDENNDFNSPTSDFGAFTVASVNAVGERSYFSSFGNSVKISAPGESILSAAGEESYEFRDGTSMAAPMASGVAAMLKAEDPSLTPANLEELLVKSSDENFATEMDKPIGSGILNAEAAFNELNK